MKSDDKAMRGVWDGSQLVSQDVTLLVSELCSLGSDSGQQVDMLVAQPSRAVVSDPTPPGNVTDLLRTVTFK
jgi:hypothetical protein